jgi:ATP/maltotriose-dependent transcriptional regulator MalT
VLVAGEAGVGKTRLLNEFIEHVRSSGGVALVGGCLEFVDRALPFGPVVEAFRQLHRSVDDATLDEVFGSSLPHLARLLPEIANGRNDLALADDGDTPSARLFEHILTALERLGDRAPTVLVIEDLHWADRSTRDLLVFLARNLRVGRVLVVGTYRTDDLNRRHPLRPVLAELERSAVQRVDVERFTRAEMREQLASILGDEPPAALVGDIHDRSDGNAFFAEELLAATHDGRGLATGVLTQSLRDVLLARADALPPAAQHVLRLAAVIGRRADHRLLVALADEPEPELLEGLREAVAHQVLIADLDGLTYRFRHALMQEVVYDDLLPGERVQMHARVAQLLTDQPSLFDGSPAALANELACHWNAARDQRRAMQSAYQAALAAEQMHAYPESLAHAERTLELWYQVPDAPELLGIDEVGLLRYAARMADFAGEIDRALALVRQAKTLVDPAVDPVTAGILREREARALWSAGHHPDVLLPLNHEAVQLVPAEPPSPERAQVLAALAQQLMLAERKEESIAWCEEAIEVAREVGARVVEGHARNTLGTAYGHLGEVEAGLAQLHLARDIARETRSWADLARAAINEAGVLQADGRHAEAVDISLAGADEAVRHGLARSYGAFLRLNAAGSLRELGRFDEMEEQLGEVDAVDPIGVDQQRACEEWLALHVVRGRFDAAATALDRYRARQRGHVYADSVLGLVIGEAELLRWRGEPERVHELVTNAWDAIERERGSDWGHAGFSEWVDSLLVEGVAADADVAERARARRDDGAVREAVAGARALHERFAKAQMRFSQWKNPPKDAVPRRMRADAELARAEGRPDAESWRQLADVWAASDRQPNIAYARWREAEARLQRGDGVAAATEPLREAQAIAARIGFAPLLAAVDDLARRARVDVADAGPEPGASPIDRLGLTAREQEVLELVAAGATNRQIADALFISTKTASVHVSNILAKLDVANRGEAAARARELGVGASHVGWAGLAPGVGR